MGCSLLEVLHGALLVPLSCQGFTKDGLGEAVLRIPVQSHLTGLNRPFWVASVQAAAG